MGNYQYYTGTVATVTTTATTYNGTSTTTSPVFDCNSTVVATGITQMQWTTTTDGTEYSFKCRWADIQNRDIKELDELKRLRNENSELQRAVEVAKREAEEVEEKLTQKMLEIIQEKEEAEMRLKEIEDELSEIKALLREKFK